MSIRLAASCILLSLFLLSCSDILPSSGCTEVGCGPAFSVGFVRKGPWAPGDYGVTVTVDGAPFKCTATLPLSCNAPSPCPEGAPFFLGSSGCALDPSEHSLSGVEISQGSAPASVQIEVTLDGNGIGSDTFTPTYTTSSPNGPGCGPDCKSAPGATLILK
jgi:hypothetical protein